MAVNGRADRDTDGLDDDERGIATVNTPSGDQEMLIVNESGLYSLIFKSRKKEAKRFRKWVTAEVLPAIRQHGRYEDEQGKMETLIGQTIGTDGFHVLSAVVAGKVRSLPREFQRRATMKMWAQVHAAFNVRSAEDIPAAQLDSARNFIAAYALEGEWIEAKKSAAVIGLNDYEAQAVHLLICHSKQLVKMVDEIYRAGGALRSDLLISVASHLWEIRAFLGMLDRQKSAELAKLHAARCAPARKATA
ncbi:BRO-N domain-containing protein [Pseudomonas oryzihabitans]|uniref:BRO-N domain-containing protein n=1 Tax=Pseudomonas oryzihabitans TaxID=47885 RepID=UPI001F10C684|nr:BRO family protein [Pseudomonas psychrotolerans]